MTTSIEQASVELDLDAFVELFEVDASLYGGTVYRITSSLKGGQTVKLGGLEYQAVDFEADGFEWKGTGPLPKPTIRIANVTQLLTSIIVQYHDLLGCEVRRIQTFKRFLDGEVDEDPTQHFSVEVYRVERKVTQNKLFVEFELSSILDQQSRMIPARQIIRESCTFIYRRYDPTSTAAAIDGFVYDLTVNACPFAGTTYFDTNGQATSKENDKCSKYLTSGCLKRFVRVPVPFRGFPGAARTRVN